MMSDTHKYDPQLTETGKLILDLLAVLPERRFAVRLADGTTIQPDTGQGPPQFTVWLKRPAGLRRMFLPPSELGLGEGFIYDDYDIEGDLVAAFGLTDALSQIKLSVRQALNLGWRLLKLERNDRRQPIPGGKAADMFTAFSSDGRRKSHQRDREAARFHYDLSNDFFKLWLDERLVYSCALFADEQASLEEAQVRKLDRICRRLQLRPGERLLDIGCGFGALLIHAATHYGVQATGISLSNAQTAEAQSRIQAAGIADRCCIQIVHYEAYAPEQPFDKLASIGMFEHVGEEKLSGYFTRAFDMLRPGGLFLLQGGLSRHDRRHVGRGWMDRLGLGRNAFMQKYSFPDSRLVDLPTMIRAAVESGFETQFVESLREHYPLTLRHWLHRLESNRDLAVAEVGQAAYRAWRLMLAGYIYLIEMGQLTEYQSLFARPDEHGRVCLPLT